MMQEGKNSNSRANTTRFAVTSAADRDAQAGGSHRS